MAKIKFENGQVVNFDGNPTQQDVEEISKKLNIQKQPKKKDGFWDKLAEKGGNTMQWLGDTFISPVARELERPFVSMAREIQGGDKVNKPMSTPFGDVKPYGAMSAKESVGSITELGLTILPVEKLLGPALKGVGKLGGKLLSGTGEILTGVEGKRLSSWYDLAKNSPEKLKRTKELIGANPDNPFLGMANNITKKIGTMKDEAQKAFTEAVETVKTNFPDKKFNLDNKMPELNNTLNKYRLKVDTVKEGGKFTNNIKVNPSVRNSAYSPQELQMIDDVVQRMRLKDMNVDELLEFQESTKRFFDFATKKEDKRLMALGYDLIQDSSKYIDDVFPEIAGANKKYRDYYDTMKQIGNNVMDKNGAVKRGGESFLGNVLNYNKGQIRDDVARAGKKLGIDILGDAENIRNAKQLTEAIPNTVKSRVGAMFRSIITAESFKGGAVVGSAFNPAIGVPALVLNILSSPKNYRNLIEIIAGTSKNLPITEVIEKLTPNERFMIRNVIKGLSTQE